MRFLHIYDIITPFYLRNRLLLDLHFYKVFRHNIKTVRLPLHSFGHSMDSMHFFIIFTYRKVLVDFMKRLFGNLKMSWLSVILFAAVAGVYTGAVMLFDVLKETSFQDIGISYEFWVIFAVIVVVNCNKNWEAMLKCFVFFLISQPLVYAVQILFNTLSFDMGWYYYSSIWLPATFLTLPGGLIAYYCKKQNLLGAVILGIGNTLQAVLGIHYFTQAVQDFPHHILSGIVCFVSIFLMSFQIQKKKKYRLVSILLALVSATVLVLLAKATGRTI